MRTADGKIGAAMLHGLAYFGIGAANGDVFQRAAEAARSVPFKMRQHNHAVVSGQAFANIHFFKMLAAAYRQGNVAKLVHNIDGAEIPAVIGNGFAVQLRCVAAAFI